MKPIDHKKIWSQGLLHMGQAFPIGLVTVALPALFRKSGLPLELFWIFAIPMIPGWLRWLIAIVVDNHGHHAIGFRKSWILPCTLLGSFLYLVISQLNPTPEYLWLILAVLTLKSFIMTAQDVAVDGLVVESFDDHERTMGASILVFLSFLGTVTAQGLVAGVDAFGWESSMIAASALIVAVALPTALRSEPPQPEVAQRRREAKSSASVPVFLRRSATPRILIFLVIAGFGSNLLRALLPVFLVDLGLSLFDIGVVFGVGTLIGVSGAAWLTPKLTRTLGLAQSVLITLANYPACAFIFHWMSKQSAVSISIVACLLTYVMAVSTMMWMLVMNARIQWSSKSQAATDFSVMSSVANFGEWLGATCAGFAVAALGWTWFFNAGWTVSALSGLIFFVFLKSRANQESNGGSVSA